jgi:lipopolysaccharide transport system ATP-binding protein
MTDRVIEAEHISKRYLLGTRDFGYNTLRDAIGRAFRPSRTPPQTKEIWALKDVSFQLDQGDALGLIGRNGSGKSTLLKVLSRITHPTLGKVRLKGRVASLLEVGTGFHPELTGRENIYLSGSILGMSRNEIRESFEQIVEFAEIEQFLDTPVKRYSSGMYLRLAFSVAAHLTTEILMVDEVLAVGDTEFQRRCLGRMSEAARSGRTVIFVSHHLWSIEALCSRAILLSNGTLQASGSPREVITRYLSNQRPGTSWDLSGSVDRQGTGSILLDRLELLGADGAAVQQVQFLSSFRLRIHFHTLRKVLDPDFGVAILDERGERIFVCLSHESGLKIAALEGSGTIDCLVVAPPILPRSYSFEVWAIDVRGVSYGDHVQRVGELNVSMEQFDEHNVGELDVEWRGPVYVRSQWQFSLSKNIAGNGMEEKAIASNCDIGVDQP